ncbi:hypothetical protein BDN70DRAFT_879767 [Pholiota conissans]|uniref:Uncharacterized protein n=1 Tax=Pholiota conissans TaxID=109636 RepID=A0A9P5Z200_9AGAR|nr:hypothetical protein BDN70DRAFT_879767 [Pholiota conissans]
MATRSVESFLYLDFPASTPFSRSSYISSGSHLVPSEKSLRPRDSSYLAPDMNNQQYAYTHDLPLLTRERPVSFCPNLTPGLQQHNVQHTPRRTRRFSECLDVPRHQDYACPLRTHELDASRTVNSDLSQSAIRRPPLNHRRSWRYGTDFGLNGRTGDRALERRDSSPDSLESAHGANYGASISEDGMSSLYECTASDFPKPPPMTSPVIRRMRSSPWFMDETGTGRHSLQGLSDQQLRMRATLDDSFNRAFGSRAGASSSQNELSSDSSLGNISAGFHRLEEPFMHRLPINSRSTPDRLDMAGRNRLQSGLSASASENPHSKISWSNVYQRPNKTLYHSPFTQQPNTTYKNLPAVDHHNAVERPIGRLPRIIRKVASMRSEVAQKVDPPASQALHGTLGRKSIPKARSYRSILQHAEADRARERANAGGEWHRPSSWVLKEPVPFISHSGLSNDQEQTISRRQHLSVPLSNTSHGATARERRNSSTNGGVLGAPFLHRPFGNHSFKKGQPSVKEQCEGPNSFMNITPDRDSKSGGKRERVKDFLSRASSSMFGWGKQRTKQNSASGKQ